MQHKKSTSSVIIFQKWRKNKDFLGQTKTEEIRCQQSYLVRNVKFFQSEGK